jgi:hypothetical protein
MKNVVIYEKEYKRHYLRIDTEKEGILLTIANGRSFISDIHLNERQMRQLINIIAYSLPDRGR